MNLRSNIDNREASSSHFPEKFDIKEKKEGLILRNKLFDSKIKEVFFDYLVRTEIKFYDLIDGIKEIQGFDSIDASGFRSYEDFSQKFIVSFSKKQDIKELEKTLKKGLLSNPYICFSSLSVTFEEKRIILEEKDEEFMSEPSRDQ